MKETELQQRIRDILAGQRIMTLSHSDGDGPWAIPVFYAQDKFDLVFVSNPNSRHGRAAAADGQFAAAVLNSNSEWRKVQGLQMAGRVEMPEGEAAVKATRGIYTRKFPFTGVFFSQQDKLPEPLRAKVTDVNFYIFRPERIVLVDNTIHFGFHYEYTVSR
jgi:uncharacterized protein